MLAYSAEVYFSLLEQYNNAIWLVRLFASLLGVVVVFLLFNPSRAATILIGLVLSLFWAWTGIAFHWFFFADYFFLAPVFAGIFVLQALTIAWVTWRGTALRFVVISDFAGWTGAGLIFLAMVALPFLAPVSGHAWSQAPMFGVSSPTVVLFTLGVMMMAKPGTWLAIVIPLLWCAYSAYVAWALPSLPDAVLPAAGLLAIAALVSKRR